MNAVYMEHKKCMLKYCGMKGLTTIHALLYLRNHYLNSDHLGKTTHVLFFDYSKSIYLIDHTILINKFTALVYLGGDHLQLFIFAPYWLHT